MNHFEVCWKDGHKSYVSGEKGVRQALFSNGYSICCTSKLDCWKTVSSFPIEGKEIFRKVRFDTKRVTDPRLIREVRDFLAHESKKNISLFIGRHCYEYVIEETPFEIILKECS